MTNIANIGLVSVFSVDPVFTRQQKDLAMTKYQSGISEPLTETVMDVVDISSLANSKLPYNLDDDQKGILA